MKWPAILGFALIPVLVRLLLLPWIPAPQPAIHDEFSYLLAADTFASGRLTNPPHPLWQFFESEHVIQQPTYMSKYPPLTGLILAAGQRLFGHPWAGVLISMAVFCGVLCWTLQGWFSPRWAFIGTLIGVLQVAFLSYWSESYWGGFGAAIGGGLLVGSLTRIVRSSTFITGLPAAIGVALLSISRPFEGLLLTILCYGYLIFRIAWKSAGRAVALPLLVVMAPVCAWHLYYDYRVTGDPLTMPYAVHEKQYASAALFLWNETKAVPEYRHEAIRRLWVWELEHKEFQRQHPWVTHLSAYASCVRFYWGTTLLVVVLVGVWPLAFNRRTRVAFWLGVLFLASVGTEVNFIPHYLAPATALACIAVTGALRSLRLRWGISAFAVVLLLLAVQFAVRYSDPTHRFLYDKRDFIERRQRIVDRLQQTPGKQLVVVRFGPKHNLLEEWIYNRADIDAAQIVWARSMGPAKDQALVSYYRDRHIWLLDENGTAQLSEYPLLNR